MTLSRPTCVSCGDPLTLSSSGTFDAWVCPSGHGVAATLSETYERLQEDELARLWRGVRTSPLPAQTGRRCPICAAAMAAIGLPYDADESEEGEAGDTADLGTQWLDVCEACQLIWFDAGALEALPADLPDVKPSAEELAAVERVREAFGEGVVEASRAREANDLSERLYRRIARHPGLSRTMTEIGSLGRR